MIGDLAHVCNRGMKKQNIFLTDADRLRFVLNLYRLNNKGGSLRITNKKDPFQNLPEQERLVDILKWNLMPNHYHLLLHERIEGGVVEFMKRLGNAYTKYFNIKNSGSGYVFQNSAKIIRIVRNEHYLHIPFYVDLNPADLIPRWKSGEVLPDRAVSFLKNYKWSSYRDYFGKESEFLPIINKELFYELFDTDPLKYPEELLELLTEEDFKENMSTWQVDTKL